MATNNLKSIKIKSILCFVMDRFNTNLTNIQALQYIISKKKKLLNYLNKFLKLSSLNTF